MNKTEENLYDNLLLAMNEIKKYILSNDDWIFYFVSNISCNNDNKQLFDIVSKYPEDWESYISLDFVSFSGPSIQVSITIDYENHISKFTRHIYLLNFEDTVNRNKKLYEGYNDAFNDAVEYLETNLTFEHPRKGTKECIVNIRKFREFMNDKNEIIKTKYNV